MKLHLAEVATAVAADAHAVMLLDQAGWHIARDLIPCLADRDPWYSLCSARRRLPTRRAYPVSLISEESRSARLGITVPPNITLMPLPPRAPELNPVENIWQFMRDNWLSNRVFASYENIIDHCCYAWNKLTDQPGRIMPIGLRDWAHGF